MSANERAESVAFKELESLVRSLGEELAVFRRRAMAAEAQLKEAGQTPRVSRSGEALDRASELELENQALRERVTSAEERIRHIMDRVRFLRQQLQSQPTLPAGRA
jgi:predicted  nucleic acid-binding Zn-ribbon protein